MKEAIKPFPAGYNENGESVHFRNNGQTDSNLRCTILATNSLSQEIPTDSKSPVLKEDIRTFSDSGVPVYILSSHNHALFAWREALEEGHIDKNATLFHFDYSIDGLEPSNKISYAAELPDVASYAQSLEPNQYIDPAFKLGIVDYVQWFANRYSTERAAFPFNQLIRNQLGFTSYIEDNNQKGNIVDIDMNYFQYLWYFLEPNGIEYMLFKNLIRKAGVVTISFNPEQSHVDKALRTVKTLIGQLPSEELAYPQFTGTLASYEEFKNRITSKNIINALVHNPVPVMMTYARIPKNLEDAVTF